MTIKQKVVDYYLHKVIWERQGEGQNLRYIGQDKKGNVLEVNSNAVMINGEESTVIKDPSNLFGLIYLTNFSTYQYEQ